MRFFIFLITILLAGVAGAAPTVKIDRPFGDTWTKYTVTFDGTTAESKAMQVHGQCLMQLQHTGVGTISLWQVPTESTAYSSGAQIGTDYTVQPTSPLSFQAGTRFVKVVATVASEGSVAVIHCSNTQLGSASGGATVGEGPLSEMVASNPSVGDLWIQDDDNGTADCVTGTGGTADVLCMYTDGGAWAPTGIAGGTDNLGSGSGGGLIRITDVDGVEMDEQADHGTIGAGEGEFWVRNDTPSLPLFTDDAGNDYILNAAGTRSQDLYFISDYDATGTTEGLAEAIAACENVATDGGVVVIDQLVTIAGDPSLDPLTKCDIQGYGAYHVAGGGSPYVDGVSVITWTSTLGITLFNATENGVDFRDFGVVISDGSDDASTFIIDVNRCTDEFNDVGDPQTTGVADGLCDVGKSNAGIRDIRVDGVVLSTNDNYGTGAGALGTGLRLANVYSASIDNSHIKRLGSAIVLYGTTQEVQINNTSARESGWGLYLDGGEGLNGTLTTNGFTFEANVIGAYMDSNWAGQWTDQGGYCEVASAQGALGTRRCILDASEQGVFQGFGTLFGSKGTGLVTAGTGGDFEQTSTKLRGEGAAGVNTINVFGYHGCKSCSWYYGADIANSQDNGLVLTNSRKIRYDAQMVGRVWDDSVFISSDCDVEGTSSHVYVTGALCIQSGTPITEWICDDTASYNGICAEEAAWLAFEAKDYVWGGAHNFGGATSLEVPTDGTIDDPGEISLDTVFADWQAGLIFNNGTEERRIISIPTADLATPANDYILKYNNVTNDWEFEADSGTGSSEWTDTTAVVHLPAGEQTDHVCNDATCTQWEIEDTGEATFDGLTVDGNISCSVAGCTIQTTPSATAGDSYAMNEGSNNGSNTITFAAPDSITANRSCELDDSATPFDGCVTDEITDNVSGTSALGTSSIAANSCATLVTTSATGVASTDAIIWTPNADIETVDGYGVAASGDGLVIYAYPTANNVNFKVCNATGSAIVPGAVTLNWRVLN